MEEGPLRSVYSRLSPPAMRADAGDFDQRTLRRESHRARRRLERFRGGAAGHFADCSTAFADQKNDEIVAAVIVYASDERVAALDAMNETVLAQKFERAVDRDRRRTTFLLQSINNFVGAKRPMACQQSFEHLPPYRREPLRARCTLRFRVGNGGAGAAFMVVVGGGKNCGRHDGLGISPGLRRRSPTTLL
jgi:hypothetical protein